MWTDSKAGACHTHSGASAKRVRVWSENRIPSASNADFNRLNIIARTLNCWPGRVRTMIPTWIPSTPIAVTPIATSVQ